ncbi:MAG: formylmethanofuran dehydrogenase subunit C [Planctomycetaceae bacterium]|nr:formylmethanofuran dehydrogenase subunit C [Planctomycetaceae bacterium]
MPLCLRLHERTAIPLEVDSLKIETVCHQSLEDVQATCIQYGNQQRRLDEFFEVSGSAAEDRQVVWEGDCSNVKLIGAEMQGGSMRVTGSAGMHLGAEMSGGDILVEGSAGDWVGAEMKGGTIRVQGNAGHLVGSVYRGGRRGMTGGEILIHGNAGNEVGHTMRRGLIAVGGRTGDAPGFNMIAGSILLFGEPGIRPGAGMRRGTIGLLAENDETRMLPTFRLASRSQPTFLRFYLRHLQSRNFPGAGACLSAQFDTYRGDFLELGKGEILRRVCD